jgi:hypothetical protein
MLFLNVMEAIQEVSLFICTIGYPYLFLILANSLIFFFTVLGQF